MYSKVSEYSGFTTQFYSILTNTTFTDLFLLQPRAATVIAKEDSTVWAIDRERYHMITTYFRMLRMKEQEHLVGKVS